MKLPMVFARPSGVIALMALLVLASTMPAHAAGTRPSAPGTPQVTVGFESGRATWAPPSSMGSGSFVRWEVATQDGVVRCRSTSLSTRACTATGLTNEALYRLYVRAVTSVGAGPYSAGSELFQPGPNTPSASRGIAAYAGVDSASVHWWKPLRLGTGAFVRYEVRQANGTLACTTADPDLRKCVATGLVPGTSYQFRVRAVTSAGAGLYSVLSNAVVPTASLPTAPTNVVASAGVGSASVTWDAPSRMGSGTFTTYEVQRADGTAACVSTDAAVRTCQVDGLTSGTSYQFKVRAVTSAGAGPFSALSNAVEPTAPVPTAPTAPTNVVASAGVGSASVTWDAPSSMGSGTFTTYEVQRADGTAACVSTDAAVRTCQVDGLTPGTSYQFKVRAVTSVGAGPFSALSNAVVARSAPTAPKNVVATGGVEKATVTWDEPTSMGTGTFARWDVVSHDGVTRCTLTDRAIRTCEATGLTNEQPYQFYVRAVTSHGAGAIEGSNVVIPGPDTPSAPPAIVGDPGVEKIRVYWHKPARMGSGTFVKYEVLHADGTAACDSTDEAVLNCLVEGLTGGTSYQFKVRAVTSVGEGAFSVLSDPVMARSVPTAPTNVVATAGNAKATVRWDEPTSMGTGTFTRWDVVSHDGVTRCTVTDRATRTCEATGLTNEQQYQFYVRGVTSHGDGAIAGSNIVTPSLLLPR